VQLQQISRDINGIRGYASEINALKAEFQSNQELIENRYTKKEVENLLDQQKATFVRVKEVREIKRLLAMKCE
jgi:prefoldin subunit 5